MAERIHYSDLEHLLADDNTPDEVLAEYIKPAPLRALPLAPVMTIDESKVEVPPNRGIIGLSVKSLNERANRRRLAAYQAKIDGGWKGLKLLAEGDSWFLYPILLKDILDNLSADYAVYSVAAAGDTLENMMRGLAHFEELIEKHKFEGFLLSAGGNDIAGDMLRTYLTTLPLPAKPAESYLSGAFDTFLGTTQEQLDGLFTRLTTRFPDLKIFCHGYDWPFPRTGGLWLSPALLAQQIPDAMQHAILKVMIDRYYGMLGKLAEKHRGKVMLVDCRGSVGDIQSWFDELHPLNPGYTRAAGRFRDLINQTFGISAARGASRKRRSHLLEAGSGGEGRQQRLCDLPDRQRGDHRTQPRQHHRARRRAGVARARAPRDQGERDRLHRSQLDQRQPDRRPPSHRNQPLARRAEAADRRSLLRGEVSAHHADHGGQAACGGSRGSPAGGAVRRGTARRRDAQAPSATSTRGETSAWARARTSVQKATAKPRAHCQDARRPAQRDQRPGAQAQQGLGRLDRGCRPPVARIRSQSLGAGGGRGHRHRARHHARSRAWLRRGRDWPRSCARARTRASNTSSGTGELRTTPRSAARPLGNGAPTRAPIRTTSISTCPCSRTRRATIPMRRGWCRRRTTSRQLPRPPRTRPPRRCQPPPRPPLLRRCRPARRRR